VTDQEHDRRAQEQHQDCRLEDQEKDEAIQD